MTSSSRRSAYPALEPSLATRRSVGQRSGMSHEASLPRDSLGVMRELGESGQVVILNGAPRSGKSSVAAKIQETFDGTWMDLGVDVARLMTPPCAQPRIGLRPSEADHPAASIVPVLYAALYESVAAHSRLGLNVVVDVGHYEIGIAVDSARRLTAFQSCSSAFAARSKQS